MTRRTLETLAAQVAEQLRQIPPPDPLDTESFEEWTRERGRNVIAGLQLHLRELPEAESAAAKGPKVTYRLVKYAAHYGDATKKNGGGHDLDEWDITAESLNQAKAIVLLQGAEFRHGYVDNDGAQHWVFSRLAPFSAERCERCPGGGR